MFQILLELIVLGTFPEGLTLLVAGAAQAVGADVVGLFVYIVGNLAVLALWMTRPKWAKPHWMRDATLELPS